jgi:hypothetical protein
MDEIHGDEEAHVIGEARRVTAGRSHYDVFLSYASGDEEFVERLARKLDSEDIHVFLSPWHLVPGERWQEALEEALDRSNACAVFMGRTLGPWQNREMRAALETEAEKRGFRLIPVLLPGVGEIPRFLRALTWVDFRAGIESETAFHRLLAGIHGTAPGPGTDAAVDDQRKTLGDGSYAGREASARDAAFFRERNASVFVGRNEELAEIDALLARHDSGLLLIRGGAGTGKTTLLAHLVLSLRQRSQPVIHHIFSSESRSLAEAYLHLAQQLCLHHRVELPIVPESTARLRDLVYGLIEDRGAGGGGRLIVAIDGLDEADQPFSPPFPSELPRGVFVIATVRDVGDFIPEKLAPWRELAVVDLTLHNLSREALAVWLEAVGGASADASLVDALHRMTGGYPLYTRFLIGDIVDAMRAGRNPTEVLSVSPRGFTGYVREQLKRVARDEAVRGQRGVQTLFAMLAEARGELATPDLEALCGLTAWDLEALPWSVTRWLRIRGTTGGERFAFAHPLLAAEFSAVLGNAANDARRELLRYCERWREHRSEYVLQHFPGHLVAEGRILELQRLLTDSPLWMETRRAVEGTISGYLSDVELTLRHIPQTTLEKWKPLVLLEVARQAVRARAVGAADDALRLFFVLGQRREAEEMARMRATSQGRFRGLLTAIRELPADDADAPRLLAALRAAALAITEPLARGEALAAAATVARTTGPEAFDELFALAVEESATLRAGWARAQLNCDLALLTDDTRYRDEAIRISLDETEPKRPILAVKLARAGAVDAALTYVRTLPKCRVTALDEIAELLVERGDVIAALQVLDLARAEWKDESGREDWVNELPRALSALVAARVARPILERLPPNDVSGWFFQSACAVASAAAAEGDLALVRAAAARAVHPPLASVVVYVAAHAPGVDRSVRAVLAEESLVAWRAVPPEAQGGEVGPHMARALINAQQLEEAAGILELPPPQSLSKAIANIHLV